VWALSACALISVHCGDSESTPEPARNAVAADESDDQPSTESMLMEEDIDSIDMMEAVAAPGAKGMRAGGPAGPGATDDAGVGEAPKAGKREPGRKMPKAGAPAMRMGPGPKGMGMAGMQAPPLPTAAGDGAPPPPAAAGAPGPMGTDEMPPPPPPAGDMPAPGLPGMDGPEPPDPAADAGVSP